MGWLAVVLAGLAGAALAKPAGPDIVYQYRIVEMHGLQWREQAGAGLKPVTSHGAVSVWTAPASFLKSLPAGTAGEVRTTISSRRPQHDASPRHHAEKPVHSSLRPPGSTRRRISGSSTKAFARAWPPPSPAGSSTREFSCSSSSKIPTSGRSITSTSARRRKPLEAAFERVGLLRRQQGIE